MIYLDANRHEVHLCDAPDELGDSLFSIHLVLYGAIRLGTGAILFASSEFGAGCSNN